MARSVRLRPWQKRALEAFAASSTPDFLAVATPGAGKTTFALTAARTDAARSPWRRLIVVVPTRHLKHQWADAADRFDLHLEPEWAPDAGLPADVHGVAVTYQQVAAGPATLAQLAASAFVIFDEIHHAGDERAWGEGIKTAFAPATRRLALSGTPFRSDTAAIPFVRYRLDEAVADFEYGYGDALRDGGVVRPVFFPRVNGHMEWSAPDGSLYAATFDDPMARALANQRLRTALSLEGEWLPAVLGQAHAELSKIRREHQPDAAGLVIAMDLDHARGVAGLLRDRFRAPAVVATSDDPEASDRIARFARSDGPWIVAVRMVSEGVDIPRLRVGVYATNTTTELFFRQAVGRLVRWQPSAGRRQGAFLFVPDDVRLRTFANELATARRHCLRRPAEDVDPGFLPAPAEGVAFDDGGAGEQLSLFAALSATPLDLPDTSVFDVDGDDGRAEFDGATAPAGETPWHEEDLVVTLAPPPPLAGVPRRIESTSNRCNVAGEEVAAVDPRRRRRELRDLNAAVVAQLALLTGLGHAQVNAELNRLAGIRRVDQATIEQLDRRLGHGRRWLDRSRTRARP